MKTHWFTKNVVTDKWFLRSGEAPLVRDMDADKSL